MSESIILETCFNCRGKRKLTRELATLTRRSS
jgi:hypothetical protein